MNNNSLDHARLRTVQYRFADGILEIAMGGMAILLGAYFYIQGAYPGSQVSEFLTGAFLVIFVGGWYAMHRLSELLKQRITYPRTGYVAYREAKSGRGWRAAAAIVGAALAAGVFVYVQLKAPPALNLMPAVFALLLAVLFGFLGFRADLTRFFAMAFISLILGGFLALSPLANILALAAFLGAMGLVMLASGIINLRAYIALNPAAPASSEENEDGR